MVDRLGAFYGLNRMPETGDTVNVLLRVRGKHVRVLVDAGGSGLHKRGYSLKRGKAPLRETLAAGMVLLSKWRGKEIVLDPFCGSGTIAIEAALIASGKAPGAQRHFAAEHWPVSNEGIWASARDVLSKKGHDPGFEIVARDINPVIIAAAKDNASRAGVDSMIRFETADVLKMSLGKGPGVIITNPPYGERLQNEKEVFALYAFMGKIYAESSGWDLSLITSYENFELAFEKRAAKNRKLYNGKIKSYLYFYYGDKNE